MTASRAGEGRADGSGGLSQADGADVLAMPHPDWLYHHLAATGDADLVTLFRQAARGPGAVPWRDDLARCEEDWFHLLAAPPEGQRRALSLHGARVLAGQLRDAAERRRSAAVAAAARAARGGAVAEHRQCLPNAEAVFRPRASAVRAAARLDPLTARGRHARHVAREGCAAWARAMGYGRRDLVEWTFSRLKRVLGGALRFRSLQAQRVEAAIAAVSG